MHNSIVDNIEPTIDNPLVEELYVLKNDPDIHPGTLLVIKPKNNFQLEIVDQYTQQIKDNFRKEHFILGLTY